MYIVSFGGTTTNKLIDEYLDTELGVDSIGWEVEALESEFSMRVGEEEEDVETCDGG